MEFKEVFTDEVGYAELKKHMRQVAEFSAAINAILQERSEIEATYAKSFAKLCVKAQKCNKDSTGSLMAAWNIVYEHLRKEAESHKLAAAHLNEEIVKKMKSNTDTQTKTRKAAEASVDKACKAWHDRRNELVKAKKVTHSKSKESEGMQAILEQPSSKGKVFSDKELGKLQTKSKKADDAASKADSDYMKLIKATERARHDFEKALRQAATSLEGLEKERIGQQKETLSAYVTCISKMQEPLQKSVEEVSRAVGCISPESDVMAIAQVKGRQADHIAQILYDPYEENLSNNMTLTRRRLSLSSKLQVIESEIQKEAKAKAGIARLCGVYSDNPKYATVNTQDDVTQQLTHSEEMLNMLRASKFKIRAALALMDKQPKPSDEISTYIKTEKDKQQGVQVSILKMPRSLPSAQATQVDGRGMGDGAHYLPPTPPESIGDNNNMEAACQPVIGQCVARFDYEAAEFEELSIKEGDIINIIQKFEDGWWYGETGGNKGNFPGSYVDLL